MSANVEAMVREGINAYKAGQKEEAKTLLLKATELDQMNEQAWLWLSGLMDSVADQRTCLENVLAINPNNERALKGLSYLGGQASNPSSYALPPAGVPPSASPPTTVEWGAPGGSPPSAGAQEDTGQVIPPDWVKNLQLPTNDTKKDSTGFDSPFSDFDFGDSDDFGGPFGSSTLDMDEVTTPRRSPEPTRRARLPRDPEPEESEPEPEPAPQLFGNIPREIKATRLPGTRERTSLLLTLGLVVLILLNLGAATLLMISLLT